MEGKKEKNYSWLVLSILVLLFLYGFDYELNYFYNEDIKAMDYFLGIASSLLLLIYILPLGLILYRLGLSLGIDRKEITIYLVCGMFIPGFLAAFANDKGGLFLKTLLSKNTYESWGLALTAPFNEEFIKLFVLAGILYLLKKKAISDYFIGGFAIGLGFQIMEDISYIGSDGLSNMDNLYPLVLSRVSGGLSSHWTYTAIFALGFYFLFKEKRISKGLILIIFVLINHLIWDSPYGEYRLVGTLLSGSMLIVLFYLYKKHFVKNLYKELI